MAEGKSYSMKVLILADSLNPWHSVWIRMGQYIQHWGYDVYTTTSICEDREGNIRGIDQTGKMHPKTDGILLYRWSPVKEFPEALYRAMKRGLPVIADIDDNLWEAGGSWTKERLKILTVTLRKVSLITCSTYNLQIMLKTMFPMKTVLEIRNSAPKNKVRTKKHKNVLRVGWTGAPWTRQYDLELIRPLTKWIINNTNGQFVHIGHHPDRPSFSKLLEIPNERMEEIRLMPYNQYIRSIDFDIGLAPLSKSNFNTCKSDLKILEYSSQGIPWICSDCDPYRDLCESWELEYRLCKKSSDWIKNFQELMNEEERRKEGEFLEKLSQSRRGEDEIAEEWKNIINNIFNN